MYYIQEADKPKKIARLFNIVKLENDKIILPITLQDKELEGEELYKLALKTNKVMSKTNSRKIVLSKMLKKQTSYVNYLYSYNYEIVDGRWLFHILILDVLQYVIKKTKISKKNLEIGILVNDISDIAIYAIKQIIKEYKNVKIVTNHINKFENIEDEILEKYGILISVGNNKRKVISKTNIILNLDFPTELINRYNINSEATVINFNGNIKIKNKRFNGLNINDYEIDWEEADKKFYTRDLYEAIQYKNQPIVELLRKIRRDNIKIKELIAVNTKI